MSGIFSGAITAGLLATVAMVAAGHDGAARSTAAEHSPSADKAYQLQLGADSRSCVVERGSLDMRGSAEINFNSACEALYPSLASARFWSEGTDGTVAFTQEDGAVVLEFAVSDGAAYQSFQPGAPLAALIALN